MIARALLRNVVRLAPRLLLACFGMSAIALADGSGGGSLRTTPIFVNDVEGSLVRAIVGLRERGLKQAMDEMGNQVHRDELYDSANMKRYIAQGMAIAGLGCAGVAVWLYLRGGSSEPTKSAARVIVSPTGVAVMGRF